MNMFKTVKMAHPSITVELPILVFAHSNYQNNC